MKGEEMMAADYYVREPSKEWESLERWENEGGRFRQDDDANDINGRRPSEVGGQTWPEAISAV